VLCRCREFDYGFLGFLWPTIASTTGREPLRCTCNTVAELYNNNNMQPVRRLHAAFRLHSFDRRRTVLYYIKVFIYNYSGGRYYCYWYIITYIYTYIIVCSGLCPYTCVCIILYITFISSLSRPPVAEVDAEKSSSSRHTLYGMPVYQHYEWQSYLSIVIIIIII